VAQYYRTNDKLKYNIDEDGGKYPTYKTYRAVSDNYSPDKGISGAWSGGYPYAQVELVHMRDESHVPNDFSVSNPNPATELFTSTGAQAKIGGAYANPTMKQHIPALLAIAKQDHPNTEFVSDHSLTPDSSKLAKHGIAKGLVTPSKYNTEADATSIPELTDADSYKMGRNPFPGETVIPKSEVMQGKQFLRQVLGRGRTPQAAPAPKFDQPRLPGME